MTTPKPTPQNTLRELVERLERLAEKATPGPWKVQDDFDWAFAAAKDDAPIGECYGKTAKRAQRNADFIAACDPQTILTLCTAVRTQLQGAQTGADGEV